MDISELMTQDAHEEGVEVEILHPVSRESMGVFFTVLGVDSKAYQVADKKAYNAQIATLTKSGKLSEDETINLEIAQVSAVITGWRGIESGDKDVPYSKKKCLELMTKSPWMRKQIDRFLADRKNFIKG
jgi:hypothetical protein